VKPDERQFLIFLALQMALGNYDYWWRDYPMNHKRREYLAEKWYRQGIAEDHCRLTPKGVQRAIDLCDDPQMKAQITEAFQRAHISYGSIVWPGEREHWQTWHTIVSTAIRLAEFRGDPTQRVNPTWKFPSERDGRYP